MSSYDEIIRRLLHLCEEKEDITGVIMIGSRARNYAKADKYSDLDLIIACDNPEKLLYHDEYMNRLGKRKYSFVEPTIIGEKERRVLFDNMLDVDFVPVKTEILQRCLKEHSVDGILNRGYRVLYDTAGFAELLKHHNYTDRPRKVIIAESQFKNLVNDFLFHTVWAEKKINRGELWVAMMCIDGYLKKQLLEVIELYALCKKGKETDVWHEGRMLEKWADEEIVAQLKECFAVYEEMSMRSALEATKKMFLKLAGKCAEALGYSLGVDE